MLKSPTKPSAPREKGEPFRLCILIPSLRWGVRHNTALVAELQDRGVNVRVITAIGPSSDRPEWLTVLSGRRLRLFEREDHVSLIWASWRFIPELVRFRPHAIVCVEFGVPTVWGLIGAKITRASLAIVQEHAYREKRRFAQLRRLERTLLTRSADVLIANTRAAERYLIGQLRAEPEKIACFPFLVPSERADLLQSAITLPPKVNGPRFLYVGRLVRGKNVAAILKAAMILRSRGIGFDVVILGDGPDQRALERMRLELNLQDVVHFAGSVPHEAMGTAYQQSDVVIQPTLGDYRSVAVLEAMRFGKPIIDSIFDGNAGDTVVDGITGFVFDSRSPRQLARTMERFSAEPDLVRVMGPRAEAAVADARASEASRRLLEALGERSTI